MNVNVIKVKFSYQCFWSENLSRIAFAKFSDEGKVCRSVVVGDVLLKVEDELIPSTLPCECVVACREVQ